ncbi:(2Fe-2S)-binding protein [Cupriavidus sp. D39]|uniref:(2Fe-2S)-binding protein n=1 Tax=Cupriavidus sp. D39 TaxID=2997877 RepID=UPI002270A2C3|nr:(2Fe-2S)-binding protein [Cupriavidus sp. D39]MCY0854433.1 (2Fe-2S)-binding protein [Cupriavidus sp. D39]
MLPLNINGKTVSVQSDPDTPLLWVLRCELGLTGTKYGCGIGVCRACTVQLNGEPQVACMNPISGLATTRIVTIEGLRGPQAQALKAAWIDLDVVQCGYCQSAQLMTASALLKRISKPSDADIDKAMEHIVCRCGTYPRIRAAIHQAAGQPRT